MGLAFLCSSHTPVFLYRWSFLVQIGLVGMLNKTGGIFRCWESHSLTRLVGGVTGHCILATLSGHQAPKGIMGSWNYWKLESPKLSP